MMFSALFGVGYVIVRYRKSGYLKRLHATPLSALEFLLAQVLSRLILIMVISTGVFLATNALLDFPMEGSYLDLFLVATLGTISMIALGLSIAARVTSEELAGGLLNLVSWPMMLVSGVWFSLDGAHPWVQKLAQFFPLTHILDGARGIMLDGRSLPDISYNLGALLLMGIVFLTAGAGLFRWAPD
jgi:ABC-type multidrug transport system permease subunit